MRRAPTPPKRDTVETVTLDQLVPQDHLLRLIERHIRFDFIRDKTAHLYCAHNGRPALDPVVLFKTLFIGYLFGVRSERQLMREIAVNVAYHWFVGLRLTDKVPDHSTLSRNRHLRFAGTDIEQTIFDAIVTQAIEHGLIGGRVFYTDSTHLKASANKRHYKIHRVEQTPADYLAELNVAVAADRDAHGKKLLPPDDDDEPPTKDIKVSPVDSDAGYTVRDGKPTGFFYLDHRTVDGAHALFADAKELHGQRLARFRGLAWVRAQALWAATCQNMKKMARLIDHATAWLDHCSIDKTTHGKTA